MSGNLVRLPGTKRLMRHLEGRRDDALQDWTSSRALMVLTGCYLCAAGILLTLAWLALPYSPAAANEAGLIRVSVLAAVLGGWRSRSSTASRRGRSRRSSRSARCSSR